MRTIVKEYRQVIANLEVNQKELKAKANKSCAQDGAAQSQLILTTTDLWINYAAYYIVKHNLYNINMLVLLKMIVDASRHLGTYNAPQI